MAGMLSIPNNAVINIMACRVYRNVRLHYLHPRTPTISLPIADHSGIGRFTATLGPLEETEVGYQLHKEAVDEGVNWNAEEEGAESGASDLHISTAQFSWFASIFYIGYLVSAEPMTWLLQRYPIGRVLGVICFFWVSPGLGLMTPFWWILDEQPYCFNGVAGIFGDFLAYGLGHATNSKVPPWALIFLVIVLGAVWGVFMFLTLPDSPVFASFLSQRQKTIAVKRVAENRTGTKNKFIASIAAQIPNGVVSNFSSAGYPRQCQIVSLVLSGYLAGRFKNSRAIMMFIGNATCIVAAAALTYAPRDEKWGRLVAFWFTSFQSVGFSLSLVMIPANVGGFTKRQNIAGPHVLLQSEAEIGYPTATKSMIAGYVVKTTCHLFLALYMWNSNRLSDRDAVSSGESLPEEERARLAESEGMIRLLSFGATRVRMATSPGAASRWDVGGRKLKRRTRGGFPYVIVYYTTDQ
ncbi:MFS general substrate transporter [Mycena polygramma]|nr:MFS general substrate transporter [Mycena polygramma]